MGFLESQNDVSRSQNRREAQQVGSRRSVEEGPPPASVQDGRQDVVIRRKRMEPHIARCRRRPCRSPFLLAVIPFPCWHAETPSAGGWRQSREAINRCRSTKIKGGGEESTRSTLTDHR
ncbi:hypothetical protein GQ53DRAFT_523377 [Thozetella sp. PMI_491]|nr:hypothetical protein GQ53DRAFT_523377 [Thozetella sp. PMI_491]